MSEASWAAAGMLAAHDPNHPSPAQPTRQLQPRALSRLSRPNRTALRQESSAPHQGRDSGHQRHSCRRTQQRLRQRAQTHPRRAASHRTGTATSTPTLPARRRIQPRSQRPLRRASRRRHRRRSHPRRRLARHLHRCRIRSRRRPDHRNRDRCHALRELRRSLGRILRTRPSPTRPSTHRTRQRPDDHRPHAWKREPEPTFSAHPKSTSSPEVPAASLLVPPSSMPDSTRPSRPTPSPAFSKPPPNSFRPSPMRKSSKAGPAFVPLPPTNSRSSARPISRSRHLRSVGGAVKHLDRHRPLPQRNSARSAEPPARFPSSFAEKPQPSISRPLHPSVCRVQLTVHSTVSSHRRVTIAQPLRYKSNIGLLFATVRPTRVFRDTSEVFIRGCRFFADGRRSSTGKFTPSKGETKHGNGGAS